MLFINLLRIQSWALNHFSTKSSRPTSATQTGGAPLWSVPSFSFMLFDNLSEVLVLALYLKMSRMNRLTNTRYPDLRAVKMWQNMCLRISELWYLIKIEKYSCTYNI